MQSRAGEIQKIRAKTAEVYAYLTFGVGENKNHITAVVIERGRCVCVCVFNKTFTTLQGRGRFSQFQLHSCK